MVAYWAPIELLPRRRRSPCNRGGQAFGTYTIDADNDETTHHIESGVFPNMFRTKQIRHYRLDGDQLVLAPGQCTNIRYMLHSLEATRPDDRCAAGRYLGGPQRQRHRCTRRNQQDRRRCRASGHGHQHKNDETEHFSKL
jgi:hypothetical protein